MRLRRALEDLRRWTLAGAAKVRTKARVLAWAKAPKAKKRAKDIAKALRARAKTVARVKRNNEVKDTTLWITDAVVEDTSPEIAQFLRLLRTTR